MGLFDRLLNQGPEGDRADYESGAGADPVEKADKKNKKNKTVMGLLGAQRGANRTWGKPDPTDEDHKNRY